MSRLRPAFSGAAILHQRLLFLSADATLCASSSSGSGWNCGRWCARGEFLQRLSKTALKEPQKANRNDPFIECMFGHMTLARRSWLILAASPNSTCFGGNTATEITPTCWDGYRAAC